MPTPRILYTQRFLICFIYKKKNSPTNDSKAVWIPLINSRYSGHFISVSVFRASFRDGGGCGGGVAIRMVVDSSGASNPTQYLSGICHGTCWQAVADNMRLLHDPRSQTVQRCRDALVTDTNTTSLCLELVGEAPPGMEVGGGERTSDILPSTQPQTSCPPHNLRHPALHTTSDTLPSTQPQTPCPPHNLRHPALHTTSDTQPSTQPQTPCPPHNLRHPALHTTSDTLPSTQPQTPCPPHNPRHPALHTTSDTLPSTQPQTPCPPHNLRYPALPSTQPQTPCPPHNLRHPALHTTSDTLPSTQPQTQ